MSYKCKITMGELQNIDATIDQTGRYNKNNTPIFKFTIQADKIPLTQNLINFKVEGCDEESLNGKWNISGTPARKAATIEIPAIKVKIITGPFFV